MKYEISPDRHRLTFTVDESEQQALRELPTEPGPDNDWKTIHSDVTMYDWFEHVTCNSDLEWIPDGITGDLTEAPMLGILGQDFKQHDPAIPANYGLFYVGCDGEHPLVQPVLERWAFEPYQVRSVLVDLRDTGKAVFVDAF
jgi:hypothetical protein